MAKTAIVILSVLLLGCNPADPSNIQDSTQSATNENHASIYFLGHCGFAVQTDNYFLIFDYVEEHLSNDFAAPRDNHCNRVT